MPKQRTRGPRHSAPVNRRLATELAEVDRLLTNQRWNEALARLYELDESFPNQAPVLERMLNVAMELKDADVALVAADQLARQAPNNPDYALALAGAYLVNEWPALALRAFRRFLQRWPNAEQADLIREQADELEAVLRDDLVAGQLTGPESLDVAAQLEELELHMARGEWPEVLRVGERVLERLPDYVPLLNNISVAAFFSGRAARGIAAAERSLAIDPANHHALSNLVRFLTLLGRIEDARPYAERLRTLDAPRLEVAIKQAEALALLGDDEGVLAVRARVSRRKEKDADQQQKGLLHHYGAVAALRLGREAEAKRLWKMALDAYPGLDLAADNLEDLQLPPGERNAPWPFALAEWMPPASIENLARSLNPAQMRSEQAARQTTRRFLERHPELAALIPLLLDRGDPPGRQLALHLALMADTPALNAALRDFALGPRGPNEMRIEAATAAQRAGLIPYGDVRMWSDGVLSDMLLLNIEVYDEPVDRKVPRRAQELHSEAGIALQQRDGATAERLLTEARALAPDDPSILNNLAMAHSLQGRNDEALALTREIERRFPDYLFGIVSRALTLIRQGALDEAAALINPLWQGGRLHISEVAAAMSAQLELMLARGNPEGASDWLELWREIDPERVEASTWDQRVTLELMQQRLEHWQERRGRRRR